MKIKEVWRSGLVRRWHCHPDFAHTNQTNAAHQWGVAMIAMYLFPDDDDLLKAALLHDVGEVNLGDLSAEAKRGSPILQQSYQSAETNNLEFMDVEIPDCYKRRLDLCDMIEAYLWAKHHRPDILETTPWGAQVLTMLAIAEDHGKRKQVEEILKS